MRVNLLLPALSLLFACGESGQPDAAARNDTAATTMTSADPVQAMLRDSTGRELGLLTLRQDDLGVRVVGAVGGLSPGRHGFHVHAVGQCAPDFAAAGSHWNPTGKQHGTENDAGPHLGDLANLEIGDDSTGTVNHVTPGGRLEGEGALLDADGAALVVHADPDDLATDPGGDSGDRIACGVIGR